MEKVKNGAGRSGYTGCVDGLDLTSLILFCINIEIDCCFGLEEEKRKNGDKMRRVKSNSGFVSFTRIDQSTNHCRDFNASTSHSIASSNPVPFIAEVLKICHFRSLWVKSRLKCEMMIWCYLNAANPNSFATSVGDIAPSISCLFAKTNNIAASGLCTHVGLTIGSLSYKEIYSKKAFKAHFLF